MEMMTLCREMVRRLTPESGAPRYVVRFSDPALHRRFVDCLKSLSPPGRTRPREGWPEVFDAARLVRFRLDGELPEAASCGLAWEEDKKISLSATKVYLPFSGGTALDFDPGKKIPWGVAEIGAPKLWKQSKGRRVQIGIVDTGADYRHPDIRHALRKGVNILNHRLPAEDDNGHGTHIAGTIAAWPSGAAGGIRGVAPGAEIYPVKAFDRDGSAYVSDIVLAINWCLANRMDIINMSFGMPDYSPTLHDAIKEAWTSGVVVVASSGNSGKKTEVDFPARSSDAIAVGALNRRGRIASFSNSGKEVDIYAPGEAIYSAWPKGRYNELNGTSMAAAHVSGAIALILSRRPGLTPAEVRKALVRSASPISGSADRAAGSAGKLNAVRAFTLAAKETGRRRSAVRSLARRRTSTAGQAGTAGAGTASRRHQPGGKALKTAGSKSRDSRVRRTGKTAPLKPAKSGSLRALRPSAQGRRQRCHRTGIGRNKSGGQHRARRQINH